MIEVNNPLGDWHPPHHHELARIEREAGERALGHLAGKIRHDAAQTPLWEEFEPGVHAHGGESYVGLHPDHPDHQRYFDLEYGTEDIAPTGFLRNALTRHQPAAGQLYSSELLNRVWGRR